MTSRRAFLQSLGTLAVVFSVPTAAHAASKALRKDTPQPRFTSRIRALTAKLVIPKGRWKIIICHHSGIKSGNAASYDREHRRRGMENGLAYHFVIGNGIDSGDGEIQAGPRWLKQIKGGHVRSDEINEVAIGICLVGNLDETKPTRNQLSAFRELMNYLRDEVVGRRVRFQGHKEAHPHHTACPGRHFPLKEMYRLYG